MSEPVRKPAPTDHETIDMLRDSASDFCRRSLGVARLRALRGVTPAFDRAQWSAMCELGWSAIVAPESAGGLGLGAAAIGAVCRQLGRVLAPEPMIEIGAGAVALLAACPTANGGTLLARLLSGDILLSAALAEEAEFPVPRAYGLAARVDGAGFVIDGSIGDLPLADAVDGFILPANLAGEIVLVYCAADSAALQMSVHALADGSTSGTLICRALRIEANAVLGQGQIGEPAHEAAVHARGALLAQRTASGATTG